MRIRSLFIWLAAGSAGLVLLTALALLQLGRASNQLSAAEASRYQSYLLADMLRQSSDDLTRLARTYVVTGDAKYETQYWDILAIRNGKKPMPEAYHRIYWDFVAAGEAKPRPDGRTVSLQDLMKEAGFTDAEFAKLDEAKRNSDGLVKTETIAMNAVKGKFDDGNGGYTKEGPPDLEMARKLMHDAAYHTEKAKIMRPVDEFYVLMEDRTGKAIAAAQNSKSTAQTLVWLAVVLNLVGLAGALAFAFNKLISTLGGEPVDANHAVRQVADGQLQIVLPNAPSGSLIHYLQQMQQSLRQLIGGVQTESTGLGQSASKLADLSGNILESAHQQQTLASEMAAAVEQFATGIDDIAREASQASAESRRAGALSAENRAAIESAAAKVTQLAEQMHETSAKMEALADASRQVSAVVGVIKEVADQTNLLALNAAIEAARAGESGRGFAVVADEVRKLAERTANSTQEIGQTLEQMRSVVEAAEGSVSGSIAEIGGVVSSMASVAQSVGEAETASRETRQRVDNLSNRLSDQQHTSAQLAQHIEGLAAMAERTRVGMDTLEGTSRALTKLAASLQASVSRFAV
jgi:methyl-accepting chemotaxis protein